MPKFSQDIGVILAQVGTPENTTKPALKKYLQAFLSDERIIDLPRWYWLPILHGFVLPRRPSKIAPAYQEIWTKNGSPLLIHSRAQVKQVQKKLGSRFHVKLGFAYAEPSIRTAMKDLEVKGITRVIILPLFPQFSTSTTASIYDEIMFNALGRGKRRGKPIKKFVPTLRFIEPYYDDPDYIKVLSGNIAKKIATLRHAPDKIIVSFHGIPKRYASEGDPYPLHCQQTTALLAKALKWSGKQYQMTYQSRFGREEWLSPYTQTILPELHGQGVKHPVIISPGFTTDCLETIHELGIEGAELYEHGGGEAKNLTAISCLNSDPEWIDYLSNLIRKNAHGWT